MVFSLSSVQAPEFRDLFCKFTSMDFVSLLAAVLKFAPVSDQLVFRDNSFR